MAAMLLRGGGAFSQGMTYRSSGWSTMKQKAEPLSTQLCGSVGNSFLLVNRKKVRYMDDVGHCSLSTSHSKTLLSSSIIRQRKHISTALKSQISSDCNLPPSDVEESSVTGEENDLSTSREIYPELIGIASSERIEKELKENRARQLHTQDVKHELIRLSLPAIAGQVIEPFTQLMETAFIGRLGSTELASAGVSISIFNIVSKLLNIPLLSVATSFVAEDISKNSSRGSISEGYEKKSKNGTPFDAVAERQQLASVSTALLLAVSIGISEALALSFGSGPFLNLMGISSVSPMYAPAKRFLSLRALGAPAVVVSLALQGVLRGFKDTKTPVICLGIGNFSAIFLFPILMYYFRLGVTGAAISSVASQYIVTFLMLWHVNKRVVLLPPRLGALQFGGYIKSGGFLVGRTLASLTTMTLATSMAARQGPLAMAAHQICLQVWLAVSLITDALAASGQAMIASSVSKGDYRAVKDTTNFVLKIGIFTGILLAAILGVSFSSIATLFTKDAEVLAIARTGILFVSASQPLNALAFIFDGLHYGVSDFPYAAYSMMLVGVISSAFLLYAPSAFGLPGVWSGLSLFMGLRTMAGYTRLLSKKGPWWFLHEDLNRAEEKQPLQLLMWAIQEGTSRIISQGQSWE